MYDGMAGTPTLLMALVSACHAKRRWLAPVQRRFHALQVAPEGSDKGAVR
jgi:hypothetical protein